MKQDTNYILELILIELTHQRKILEKIMLQSETTNSILNRIRGNLV